MQITVGELKAIIKDLDDGMLVGGSGHFGEYLDCFGISVQDVYLTRRENEKKRPVLCISIESAGDEPD